mmetsp:Transcript_9847/g.32077  ORF Transcript_9847/g.32077 Transcript_9847/m.32077 type:complete len:251 (-) Transcript_9847:1642-2394(-)
MPFHGFLELRGKTEHGQVLLVKGEERLFLVVVLMVVVVGLGLPEGALRIGGEIQDEVVDFRDSQSRRSIRRRAARDARDARSPVVPQGPACLQGGGGDDAFFFSPLREERPADEVGERRRPVEWQFPHHSQAALVNFALERLPDGVQGQGQALRVDAFGDGLEGRHELRGTFKECYGTLPRPQSRLRQQRRRPQRLHHLQGRLRRQLPLVLQPLPFASRDLRRHRRRTLHLRDDNTTKKRTPLLLFGCAS